MRDIIHQSIISIMLIGAFALGAVFERFSSTQYELGEAKGSYLGYKDGLNERPSIGINSGTVANHKLLEKRGVR